MRIPVFLFSLFLPFIFHAAEPRPVLVVKSKVAELVVDLGGGSISDFHLNGNGLNPLQWDSWAFRSVTNEDPPMTPRSMGHFICLDRWGSASEAEQANGLTNHGEASQVWWEVSQEPVSQGGVIEAILSARLPLAGLSVERTIRLQENASVVSVTESVKNHNPFGRIYNLVQHPTVGGPFLDEDTIVDANGTRGFMQDRSMPNPEIPEVQWPRAIRIDGAEVDIRYLKDDHQPNVVSYVLEDEYGWVTASSPNSGLLIGYLWKASEFPWLNIWRHVKEGKPYARGLEFGTTGLHVPGHSLVAKGKIFDRALYRYIDASETQTFQYANFLLEIPKDFTGVSSVKYEAGKLSVVEAGKKKRAFYLSVSGLF